MKKNRLSNILLFSLLLVSLTIYAGEAPDIVIKGLSDHKAIVEYQGALLILKEGQEKKGLYLLRVDNSKAVIRIGESEYSYFLDNSINQRYAKPATSKKKVIHNPWLYKEPLYSGLKKSRLLHVRLIEAKHDSIILNLKYLYSGDYGENTQMVVSLISDGRLNKNIKKLFIDLEEGQIEKEITIKMSSNSEIVFHSDAINFVFMDREQKTSVFYSKTIKYAKYWNKVSLR